MLDFSDVPLIHSSAPKGKRDVAREDRFRRYNARLDRMPAEDRAYHAAAEDVWLDHEIDQMIAEKGLTPRHV